MVRIAFSLLFFSQRTPPSADVLIQGLPVWTGDLAGVTYASNGIMAAGVVAIAPNATQRRAGFFNRHVPHHQFTHRTSGPDILRPGQWCHWIRSAGPGCRIPRWESFLLKSFL